MTPALHKRLISISLALYFIATWCSMAGMEIFGWLTFALTISYVFRAESEIKPRDIAPFIPWKACLLLLLITVLGVFINAKDPEIVYDIGAQRWMILLFSTSLAIALVPPGRKGFRFFLIFIGITGAYAIFQCITGIDITRPGSHRAVQTLLEMHAPWRSAGWFGSPLQYGYIAGMHVCLAFAYVLLTYRDLKTSKLTQGALLVVILVGASIITTFTRGAWIALACAWFGMALIAAPRIAALLAGTGLGVAVAASALSSTFRDRLVSLTDPAYSSNAERWFLWKANWEMFKDYPILGLGYSENENRAGEYVTRMGKPDAFTGHAHNNYLQFLSGTGITGLATYLFIIGFMLYITWRLYKTLPEEAVWPRAIALGAVGAQIHLHMGGFTECNFKAGATNHNFMMVWAFVVAGSALHLKQRDPNFEPERAAQ